ncbi:MAG: phytanoyl-CoA dioxygenase family protein [Bacteroidetes bacterium]|nr:phytanoyl-CoA dioxygenase family protein [Bacteroidota bacterium]
MITASFGEQGFAILDEIFSRQEIAAIISRISAADTSRPQFRKTKDLFAIRRFLHEIPGMAELLFTPALMAIVRAYAGGEQFLVKSIYFDKPEGSNWFVAWHQDLTISVDRRLEHPGFENWTVKQGQFAVQPPVNVLESILTVRIHLDDADEGNGALRVVSGSHRDGVVRADTRGEGERVCCVGAGGVMLMKPLLLHASGRVSDSRQRRVIHLEFCDRELPEGLGWAERIEALPGSGREVRMG